MFAPSRIKVGPTALGAERPCERNRLITSQIVAPIVLRSRRLEAMRADFGTQSYARHPTFQPGLQRKNVPQLVGEVTATRQMLLPGAPDRLRVEDALIAHASLVQ